MKLKALFSFALLLSSFSCLCAARDDIPKTIADSLGEMLKRTEDQFYSVADAIAGSEVQLHFNDGQFRGGTLVWRAGKARGLREVRVLQ
jgi:hypothetical protein